MLDLCKLEKYINGVAVFDHSYKRCRAPNKLESGMQQVDFSKVWSMSKL